MLRWSGRSDGGSPDHIFNSLNSVLHFTLDVCATPESTKCKKHFSVDALTEIWRGACWMNPPYKNLIAWVTKAHESAVAGATVACLLPVWTGTPWFKNYCERFATIYILPRRLKFGSYTDIAPFNSMIVVFGGKLAIVDKALRALAVGLRDDDPVIHLPPTSGPNNAKSRVKPVGGDAIITRAWAMASAETFSIAPIRDLLSRYIKPSDRVCDPMSRNSKWGTVTNDENPATTAQYHLDAIEFLLLMKRQGRVFDAFLWDPPYSATQVKLMYEGYGRKVTAYDTNQTMILDCFRLMHSMLRVGGLIISCGWQSSGISQRFVYQKLEVLLVNHGIFHHDTIVTVERKMNDQPIFNRTKLILPHTVLARTEPRAPIYLYEGDALKSPC